MAMAITSTAPDINAYTAPAPGAPTPYIDLWIPYYDLLPVGEESWEGHVISADSTVATLSICAPTTTPSGTHYFPLTITTASNFVEYQLSWDNDDSDNSDDDSDDDDDHPCNQNGDVANCSGNGYVQITCDKLDGGATVSCESTFSGSYSGEATFSAVTTSFVAFDYFPALMMSGADLLAKDPCDSAGNALLPMSALTGGQSLTCSTTPKATTTASRTSALAASKTSASRSALASVSAGGKAKSNAVRSRGIGNAVYGLGGVLAAMIVAVAAL